MAENSEPNNTPANEGAESLVGALRFLFVGLRVIMLILVVLLFRTGCFTVEPNEQVLTFKFGKMQVDTSGQAVYDSGSSKAHWVWPQPIGNTLTLPSKSTPMTLEVKRFWHEKGQSVIARPGEDDQDSADVLTLGKDGYVITGDSYLFHVRVSLTYQVSNAVDFFNSFYALNDAGNFDQKSSMALASKVLKSHLQQAITHESSGWKIDAAFYENLNDYRSAVKQRLMSDVESLNYGLTIDRIDIKSEDKMPLRQVRGTFNKVNQANAEAQNERNTAKQINSQILLRASEKAIQLKADAHVYAKETKSLLKNLRALDQKFKASSSKDLVYIYIEAMTEVLEKVSHRFVIRQDEKGKDTYWLELGPDKYKKKSEDGDDSASK
jgi:regulator of protease activity HflC (stomatin/prohibitin superfamily)